MIRNLAFDDIEEVKGIIDKSEIINNSSTIEAIYGEAEKFLVWDENGIKGFAYTISHDENKKISTLGIYIKREERRKKIGTLLYKKMEKDIVGEGLSSLTTEFRIDVNDPTNFYKKLGYKKWYGSLELQYKGQFQPEADLKFINYEDKYYEQYAKCREKCFPEVFVKNDFFPMVKPFSKEDRKFLLGERNYIYIALDNETLIGAITIKDGELDLIMVAPEYQGKGYERKIVQFGINKELKKGESFISLRCTEENKNLKNLYESLGFEVIQVSQTYTKLITKRGIDYLKSNFKKEKVNKKAIDFGILTGTICFIILIILYIIVRQVSLICTSVICGTICGCTKYLLDEFKNTK